MLGPRNTRARTHAYTRVHTRTGVHTPLAFLPQGLESERLQMLDHSRRDSAWTKAAALRQGQFCSPGTFGSVRVSIVRTREGDALSFWPVEARDAWENRITGPECAGCPSRNAPKEAMRLLSLGEG